MTESKQEKPRLIEAAFPLKQASLDSVHEKNVRHGHISTLHIWPARRPLAASRAALIATLLPDPEDPEERKRLVERIGGRVVTRSETKKVGGRIVEASREETQGGVLRWGQETSPDVDWLRLRIREAYGRNPKVLDPFAGGGAIPLEALRLGCDVTAIDINPVAWFILKCTLEYPHKTNGSQFPLPNFALDSPTFMETLGQGKKPRRGAKLRQATIFSSSDADLSLHVRAWGHWVLHRARKELHRFYPVIDGKPAIAYLWARTVECKNCRVRIPLFKSRWLSRKEGDRWLLTVTAKPDRSSITFGVESLRPSEKGDRKQEGGDKKFGRGTMSRAGAECPCCGIIMSLDDIRNEGQADRLGVTMMAVAVESKLKKEFRPPTRAEIKAAEAAKDAIGEVFAKIPLGVPSERISTGSIRKGGVSITRWGVKSWRELFIDRQLLALGTFVLHTRAAIEELRQQPYPEQWKEAISSYLAVALDRTANYMSMNCVWEPVANEVKQTFLRFALPMTWDFAEANPLSSADRYYAGAVSNICQVISRLQRSSFGRSDITIRRESATSVVGEFDAIVTDPPYYDAIPYADLTDFFYVWLRRAMLGQFAEIDSAFASPATPKWDSGTRDGELIDDESRFNGDTDASKSAYEDGMYRVFRSCHNALRSAGRLVVVFANKDPIAWEALVSALVRAGFSVTGTWPIATEMRGGIRNAGRASLASSVWIVCRKRPDDARPGWDNRVLEDMHRRIHLRLREFWDAGIRGPDFVWAATGPALEAYSQHPVVKKANEPGQVMGVGEFLRHVRRLVVDYVVGRVLSPSGGATIAGLDDVTTYYLLHRNDFGFDDAPAGACILYALSCGLSDHDLVDAFDLLAKTGAPGSDDDDEGESDSEGDEGSGGSARKLRLKGWELRKRKGMGMDGDGRPAPLIDQVHRLMHLWRGGDVNKVNEYLDARALKRSQLFHHLLQALIELAAAGSDERSLLESISNHIASRPAAMERQLGMFQS